MNADRIKALLADQDFSELVDRMKADLTKRVMARRTSDEDRASALAQFHALDTLLSQMRSEAQNTKDAT